MESVNRGGKRTCSASARSPVPQAKAAIRGISVPALAAAAWRLQYQAKADIHSSRRNAVQRSTRPILLKNSPVIEGPSASSDVPKHRACPPVVEYCSDFQSRAAAELALLPEGSAAVDMMADYAGMKNQGKACNQPESAQS